MKFLSWPFYSILNEKKNFCNYKIKIVSYSIENFFSISSDIKNPSVFISYTVYVHLKNTGVYVPLQTPNFVPVKKILLAWKCVEVLSSTINKKTLFLLKILFILKCCTKTKKEKMNKINDYVLLHTTSATYSQCSWTFNESLSFTNLSQTLHKSFINLSQSFIRLKIENFSIFKSVVPFF